MWSEDFTVRKYITNNYITVLYSVRIKWREDLTLTVHEDEDGQCE